MYHLASASEKEIATDTRLIDPFEHVGPSRFSIAGKFIERGSQVVSPAKLTCQLMSCPTDDTEREMVHW